MKVNTKRSTAFRFFRVMGNGQAYLNLFYILVAFPLGVFYFVFLVSGLSTGISLLIVWVGIPILVLVAIGWWFLANFERLMAIYWLKEDVAEMANPSQDSVGTWARFVAHITNPVTWKSLLYLFIKFPLGMATFVILVVLLSLTVAFLGMPLIYEFLPEFQIGMFFGPELPAWEIDTMGDALIGVLIGLILWPVTLQVANGLAWVHAKFARIMLGVEPMV